MKEVSFVDIFSRNCLFCQIQIHYAQLLISPYWWISCKSEQFKYLTESSNIPIEYVDSVEFWFILLI